MPFPSKFQLSLVLDAEGRHKPRETGKVGEMNRNKRTKYKRQIKKGSQVEKQSDVPATPAA